MNTLQQEETNIVIDYFDVTINKKGTIVTLSLKNQYKLGKDVPIKKLRPNGQKVVQTGIKYFQHYLGEEKGKEIYSIRKKLYCMYTLLNWVQEIVPLSEEVTQIIQEKLSSMHSNNTQGLLDHYASPEGIETKKKLLKRNEKWSSINGKRNSDKWNNKEYREAEMGRRASTKLYERSSAKMLKNYSDSSYRAKMLEAANKSERTKAISIAAKKMWERAKSTDIELFQRMANSCGGRKNFEMNGIKMNSIEFLMAQTLNSLNIKWEYGKVINVGDNSYIPDFIIPTKKSGNRMLWRLLARLTTTF